MDFIYFEKQQNLLCGKHALNMLMQSPMFDVGILSEIAHKLDDDEKRLLGDKEKLKFKSENVDESGYYSVQVMQEAARRVNLTLTYVSSNATCDYSKKWSACICNKREHWFAARKFKYSDRWFILDSTNDSPKPISNETFNYFISRFIAGGHSVFAVTGYLSNCPADLVELPTPPSSIYNGDVSVSSVCEEGSLRLTPEDLIHELSENLDMQLERALEESKRECENKDIQNAMEISRREMEQRENDEMYEQMRMAENGVPFTHNGVEVSRAGNTIAGTMNGQPKLTANSNGDIMKSSAVQLDQ